MDTEADLVNEIVYLIGNVEVQITGNKLPSKLQVLQVFFFHLRIRNLSRDDSIDVTIREVLLFWEKAQIPTKDIRRCKQTLEILYNEWRTLGKHKGRDPEKENQFKLSLETLFDVAHGDALNIIDTKKQEFLLNQRSRTREGFIADIPTQQSDSQCTSKTIILFFVISF